MNYVCRLFYNYSKDESVFTESVILSAVPRCGDYVEVHEPMKRLFIVDWVVHSTEHVIKLYVYAVNSLPERPLD